MNCHNYKRVFTSIWLLIIYPKKNQEAALFKAMLRIIKWVFEVTVWISVLESLCWPYGVLPSIYPSKRQQMSLKYVQKVVCQHYLQ